MEGGGREARRQKRRRVERGPRSRKGECQNLAKISVPDECSSGCRTCIGKKVKCDEQHPSCGRCIRLDLSCEWAPAKLPLASRRRGLGPIKDRYCWIPQEIMPKVHGNDTRNLDDLRANDRATPAVLADSLPTEELDCQDAADFALIPVDSVSAGDDTAIFPPAVNVWRPDMFPGDTTILHIDPSLLMASPQLALFPFLSTDFLYSATSFSFTNPLDPAPSIGCDDFQAVTFHRTVFAPLKSTRVAALSAHALFLDLAAHNRMALHFLLAFSYSELAIHQGFGHCPPTESYQHFQQGSWLFTQALGSRNHIAAMISFLYLFMFWIRRDPLDMSRLRELSTFILVYVKSFGLDDLCAGGSTQSENVILSRILTYIYDRDVFCGFFGSGEVFAGFVSENHEERARIWQLSRSPFSSLDDHDAVYTRLSQVSRSLHRMVLDIYFTLLTIQHEINQHSQGSDAQPLRVERGIQKKLDQVREEHSFLFDLAANCGQQAPPLMALVTVTFFHALEIYLVRSRNSALGEVPTPGSVQRSLKELINTAYYAMAAGPVQLLERFQWALLIAGIETQDPVHRDWISVSISDPAIKGIYDAVLAAKTPSGISMRAVRELVGRRCGGRH
ncbi:hypothetical protein N7532_009967 [Penicillium argentinense]|uniref:Zn(2)-C6 fungal-type domain-containing protein n=1 Tax=Penicillium argentinense TaxID=1131581 RepID=A0A9W9EP08_9EURO|nr:uncharacterized protein N7532_009967 [Penicillium argentinense]KAJ5085196.1 hypothetical protein N7532_009967 [Penicillium argentinense]